MKWCRFQAGPSASYGLVEDETVIEVAGSPFAEYAATGTRHPLAQVKLLPPVIPPVLYAAGPNYRGHLEGMAKRRGETAPLPRRPEPKFVVARAHRNGGEHRRADGNVPARCSPRGSSRSSSARGARSVSEMKRWMRPRLQHRERRQIAGVAAHDRTLFRAKNCDTSSRSGHGSSPGWTRQAPHHVRPTGRSGRASPRPIPIWDTATWIHEMRKTATLHPGDVRWMGTEGADGEMSRATSSRSRSAASAFRNYVVPRHKGRRTPRFRVTTPPRHS